MNLHEQLEKYAELSLRKGINLQPNQEIILNAPIEAKEFVRAFTKAAYQMGSGHIHVMWNDEELSPILFEYASDAVLESFPEWKLNAYKEIIENGAALVSISASNPELLKNADPEKVAKVGKIAAMKMEPVSNYVQTGKVRWNIVSVPTKSWAKKVFPKLSEEKAVNKLWEYIFKCTRVDQNDPIAAWTEHSNNLFKYRDFLNENKFVKLHYTGPGTDLEVELPEGHMWVAGPKAATDGHEFIPNMPTEEVFTMNHKLGVNGTLASTMPLNYRGSLIDGFNLTFKDGKVVDFDAKEGKEVLKNLLDTDEGASYLGEVALVPVDSPISNLKTIFYNTLYDENASCHFALGRAYAYTIEGGVEMTKEQLLEKGANQSLTHVDFMVGSNKLNIVGIKEDGEKVQIFKKGNWAF